MYSGGNPGTPAPEGGSEKTTTSTSLETTSSNLLNDVSSQPGGQFSLAKSLTESKSGTGEKDDGGTLNVDASSLYETGVTGTGTAAEVADGTNVNDGTNGDGAPGRAVEVPAATPTDATRVASTTDGTGGPSDAPSRTRSPGGFRGADGTRGGGC